MTGGGSSRTPKLILVGHSMGGLVARYFLECLEGWRDTRRLVTFGTPYRGCPGEPCTGAGSQLPAPPVVLPAATGRRPSIYELGPGHARHAVACGIRCSSLWAAIRAASYRERLTDPGRPRSSGKRAGNYALSHALM
jgi:pimeloyl-ACP methyl ester carboxylesterase